MYARNRKLMAAALAGITAGATSARIVLAQEGGAAPEVKCYGINGCGAHSSCAVSQQDLDAVKDLLGSGEYTRRFGKSEAHTCGAHASCGAASQILNWTATTPEACGEAGGLLIEEQGNRKVAKQA